MYMNSYLSKLKLQMSIIPNKLEYLYYTYNLKFKKLIYNKFLSKKPVS